MERWYVHLLIFLVLSSLTNSLTNDLFPPQQTRSASASYPSLSHLSSTLLASDPSLSTPAAQHDHLLSLTPAALLKLHIDHYKWGGVSLTLEPEGGVWTEATQKRLERGEWDSWIEGVLVGSNEDEGTMFAVAMQVRSSSSRKFSSSGNDAARTNSCFTLYSYRLPPRTQLTSTHPSLPRSFLLSSLNTPSTSLVPPPSLPRTISCVTQLHCC